MDDTCDVRVTVWGPVPGCRSRWPTCWVVSWCRVCSLAAIVRPSSLTASGSGLRPCRVHLCRASGWSWRRRAAEPVVYPGRCQRAARRHRLGVAQGTRAPRQHVGERRLVAERLPTWWWPHDPDRRSAPQLGNGHRFDPVCEDGDICS